MWIDRYRLVKSDVYRLEAIDSSLRSDGYRYCGAIEIACSRATGIAWKRLTHRLEAKDKAIVERYSSVREERLISLASD